MPENVYLMVTTSSMTSQGGFKFGAMYYFYLQNEQKYHPQTWCTLCHGILIIAIQLRIRGVIGDLIRLQKRNLNYHTAFNI